MSLIRYREYARNYPLILLCNREMAKLISGNDANLSSHAHNRIDLNQFRDFESECNKVKCKQKIRK